MYKQACRAYPQLVRSWEDVGQPKIALKVESEEEMLRLIREAKKVGLPAASIRDAGRTQVASGTRTVAAIGPGKSESGREEGADLCTLAWWGKAHSTCPSI